MQSNDCGSVYSDRHIVPHSHRYRNRKFWYNGSMAVSFFCFLIAASTFWSAPDAGTLRTELVPFLTDGSVLSDEIASSAARFDAVIDILRRDSEPIQKYIEQCDTLAWQELLFAQPVTLPQTPLHIHVGEGQTNYLFGALRFYLAQRLVQARLFDEAKNVLDELTPENSIDPAGVLILKAVVFHHFSAREEGLAVLKEFQEIADRETVPRRSAELAKLLQFEWDRQTREDDSEKIARQMNDVRRRLGQGRTDGGTQEAEGDVMQELDRLIEQLQEQAQRQKQQGQQKRGGGLQPENPLDDAFRAELKAPGNVDRRDFSPGDHWGNLPSKDREEALLKIEREFPPHYRDIIEQYFREMAR